MRVYVTYRDYIVPVYARWANDVTLLGTFEVTAETAREAKRKASANAAYQFGFGSHSDVLAGRPIVKGVVRQRIN
jgi:hypothetical protein